MNSTSVTAGVYHGAKNSTTIGNNYEQCCIRKTQCADLFDLSYCEELFGLGNVPVRDADTVACDPDALSCKESHKETCCFGATLCVDFFDVLRCYDTCGPNMVPIVDDTVTCKTDGALCQNHPDNETCCQSTSKHTTACVQAQYRLSKRCQASRCSSATSYYLRYF